MLRDAVVDSIALVFGQMATSSRRSVAAMAGGQKQVTEMGGAILAIGARAFEPLLERLVGKPVIACVGVAADRVAQFPGYLAEYNEKYFVVVNASHEPEESASVATTEEEGGGARISVQNGCLEIECAGDDAVVVKRIVGLGANLDIGAALLPGAKLTIYLPGTFDVTHVELDRTRRLDIICPRSRSEVRYASTRPPILRAGWKGVGA